MWEYSAYSGGVAIQGGAQEWKDGFEGVNMARSALVCGRSNSGSVDGNTKNI